MSRSKNPNKKISAASVIEVIFIVILVLAMAVMLAFNFLFKKDNSSATFMGYSFYNTKAVNMLPDFPKNTVVIAKASEIKSIKENSVILCEIGERTALIRVVGIQEEDGKTYYVVKFDTAPSNETYRVEAGSVIAKAMWQINGLGSFLEFATSAVGIVIAVVIPLIFIIAIQVSRILGIKRLEDEAAALGDIDEFIQSRDEESPAAVTFTEPKFIEDVTGKLPQVGRERIREPEPRPEKVLSFDNRGRAEYSERAEEEKKESPLFTYDRLTGKNEAVRREPVHAGMDSGRAGRLQAAPGDDLYVNRPTKIEPEKRKTDELFEKYASSEKGEPVVFTPHLSNIIPDSIAAVQEETASVRKPSFDDSVKAYFEKEKSVSQSVPETESFLAEEKPAIPTNAVLPKETIAPPKKQKSSKALAELMSIIDAEETRLKK